MYVHNADILCKFMKKAISRFVLFLKLYTTHDFIFKCSLTRHQLLLSVVKKSDGWL